MAANGVSHHVVEDDLAGVETMLKWLAFVPATFPGTLPVLRSTDPIGRGIEYEPQPGMLHAPLCWSCQRQTRHAECMIAPVSLACWSLMFDPPCLHVGSFLWLCQCCQLVLYCGGLRHKLVHTLVFTHSHPLWCMAMLSSCASNKLSGNYYRL